MVLPSQESGGAKVVTSVSVPMAVGAPPVSVSKQAKSCGREDLYNKWCNSRNVCSELRQNLKDVQSTVLKKEVGVCANLRSQVEKLKDEVSKRDEKLKEVEKKVAEEKKVSMKQNPQN